MSQSKLQAAQDAVERVRKAGDTAADAALALSILSSENEVLAAGQCCVDDGLRGDAGGTPYCSLERRLIDQRSKNATLEHTLDQALVARDKLRDELDDTKRTVDTLRGLLKEAKAQIEAKDLALRERAARNERGYVEVCGNAHGHYKIVRGASGEILSVAPVDKNGMVLDVIADGHDSSKKIADLRVDLTKKDTHIQELKARIMGLEDRVRDGVVEIERLRSAPVASTPFTPNEIRLGRENERLRAKIERLRSAPAKRVDMEAFAKIVKYGLAAQEAEQYPNGWLSKSQAEELKVLARCWAQALLDYGRGVSGAHRYGINARASFTNALDALVRKEQA